MRIYNEFLRKPVDGIFNSMNFNFDNTKFNV